MPDEAMFKVQARLEDAWPAEAPRVNGRWSEFDRST